MSDEQVNAIVRALTLLMAAYEPEVEPMDLAQVDAESYTAGFRAGARSAYADAVCRLREVKADNAATMSRIGGAA